VTVGAKDGITLNVGVLLGDDEGQVIPGTSVLHIPHTDGQ